MYRLSTERPELEVTLNGGVSWQLYGGDCVRCDGILGFIEGDVFTDFSP